MVVERGRVFREEVLFFGFLRGLDILGFGRVGSCLEVCGGVVDFCFLLFGRDFVVLKLILYF